MNPTTDTITNCEYANIRTIKSKTSLQTAFCFPRSNSIVCIVASCSVIASNSACTYVYEYAITPYVIKSSYGHRNGYNHITMCNSKVNQTAIAERPATSCKHAYWPPTFIYCIVGTYTTMPYLYIGRDIGCW